jgi:hypothetical protein
MALAVLHRRDNNSACAAARSSISVSRLLRAARQASSAAMISSARLRPLAIPGGMSDQNRKFRLLNPARHTGD